MGTARIVGVKTVRGKPSICATCGEWTGKGGEHAVGDDEATYCLSCADGMRPAENSNHVVLMKDIQVEVVWPFSPEEPAPHNFEKALKYSEYCNLSYQLGRLHERNKQ